MAFDLVPIRNDSKRLELSGKGVGTVFRNWEGWCWARWADEDAGVMFWRGGVCDSEQEATDALIAQVSA
jgi:hypothetical protein